MNFGIKGPLLNALAIGSTALEILLSVMLIIGYKIKLAALGSGFLLLLFGLAMSLNTKLKFALDYSVFAAAACCLLLYLYPQSKWSIDALNKK